jgi:hypothetical protein
MALSFIQSLGGRNWWNKLDFTPRYLCRCIDQLPKAVYDKNKRIKLYWLNGEVEKSQINYKYFISVSGSSQVCRPHFHTPLHSWITDAKSMVPSQTSGIVRTWCDIRWICRHWMGCGMTIWWWLVILCVLLFDWLWIWCVFRRCVDVLWGAKLY